MQQTKIRNHTILIRLMIVFLLIVLPIFWIGLHFYRQGIALQDRLIAATMNQRFNAQMRFFSNQVKAVQNDMIYLADENEFAAFAGMPDAFSPYEQARLLNVYQRRLYTVFNTNEYVRRITLHLPLVKRTLLAVAQNESSIQPLNADAMSDARAQARRTAGQTTFVDGRMLYLYQSPHPSVLTQGKTPRCVFEVEFDLDGLLRELSALFPELPVHYALLDDAQNILRSDESSPAHKALTALAADDAFWSANGEDAFADLSEKTSSILSLAGDLYYALPLSSRVPDLRIVFFVPRAAALSLVNDYRDWVWALSFLLLAAIALYGLYAYRSVQKPIGLLLAGFARLEHGEMNFAISWNHRNEFRDLIERFNQTLRRLSALMRELYEQKILTQQAQLRHLQAQINPHFLYNNFYILDNMLLMEDYATASEFLRQLGDYFRYVNQSGQPSAALSDEVGHMLAYAHIQSTRFGSSIETDLPPLPDNFPDPQVPRLILQPLMENAFKHALERYEGRRVLCLRYGEDGDFLTVTLENSGPEIEEERLHALRASLRSPAQAGPTGLSNVHQRLQITHGTGLELNARPGGGLIVIVTLRKDGMLHAI